LHSLLEKLKTLCTVGDFSGGIVWCYSELSAIPYQLLPGNKHVRFHGVPADCRNIGEKPCLIILDGLLNSAYSKDVYDIFTKKAAIIGISVPY
jgi:hypothetical protein